jgi:hypothetical protein
MYLSDADVHSSLVRIVLDQLRLYCCCTGDRDEAEDNAVNTRPNIEPPGNNS